MNTTANKVLSTLIVDDEALARRGLKHRLSRVPGIHIVAEARNGREALEMIRKHSPDVVFLDIQMPGKNGFDVVRELAGERMPAIVFVTAYDEYAIQAFKANAIDYVLKPIEDGRLQHALDRVRENLSQRAALRHKESLLKLVSNITGRQVSSMDEVKEKGVHKLRKKEIQKLAIKDGGRTTWVPQDQILPNSLVPESPHNKRILRAGYAGSGFEGLRLIFLRPHLAGRWGRYAIAHSYCPSCS